MGDEISNAEWMRMLESAEEELRQAEKEIRRQKYKRCLRDAEGCLNKAWYYSEVRDRNASSRMWKWRQRWLGLAEKFKPE